MGNLYLMIGGEEEVFNKNRALLDDLSLNLRYLRRGREGRGGEGLGQHGDEHQHRRVWRKAWGSPSALGASI